MKKSRPWLADINEAKSDLRDELESVNMRLATDQSRLNNLNLTQETSRVQLDHNNDQLQDSKRELVKVSGKVDDMATLLHQRLDNVVNTSIDRSIAQKDEQQNLFEVRPEFAC